MQLDENDISKPLESELEALWRFALKLTSNNDDASDLVQRTCVRALEQQENYVPVGKFRSWLFRIQHRVWLNELRSKKIRSHYSLDTVTSTVVTAEGLVTPLVQGSPEDALETNYYLTQVSTAVENLPEAQRLVILLVSVEGLSYTEAAEVLDVPIGTVMSRLARARVAIGHLQIEKAPAVMSAKSC